LIGQTLSHFRITAKLGEGGMGEVYRAEDTKLGREVAIKVLPREMASDPVLLARFDREAKAVAALNHPNIVTVYSVEEARGVHFFAMELVEGSSLYDVIEALRDEGHPIAAGTTGENLTLTGFPWSAVEIGTRFVFEGGVQLEVSEWAVPCKQIAGSFQDDDPSRLHAQRYPGRARAYTRVAQPGAVREGERITILGPE
jgi:hypothetical protein